MVRFDPSRPDFAPYGLTCVRWVPTLMRRPDRHNEVELNFLESGSLTYLLGGRKVTIESGRLAAFWAAIPHQIIDATGRSGYFVVTLPLAWFLQWSLADRLVQPILHGHLVCDRHPNRKRDVLLFGQWLRDLGPRSSEDRKRATILEIQARLLRLSMSLPTFTPQNKPPRARAVAIETDHLNKAEHMACFIAQHYLDPLTVDDIAASVRLHPNYAMSLFKKIFGTTLSEYLAQHRISHAQRLLATTNEKILNVALSSGFGSISRFNHVFRQSCGCSPRRYRDQHRV